MQLHDLFLAIIAFLSELLGTISGFGSSTFFVPAARVFESFAMVLVLTALLHLFGNLSKLLVFQGRLRKDLLLKLGLPSVLFSLVGAWMSAQVDSRWLGRGLGVALVLVALVKLSGFRRSQVISIQAGGVLCAVSGLATGLVGTGGAIRGVALSGLHLGKHEFVVLSAAIDFGGDLLRAVVYLRQGYMDWSYWYYLPGLGISAWLGAKLGQRVLHRLDQRHFESVVAFFVLLSGLGMIAS